MAPRFRPVPSDSYVSSAFGPRWGTIHRGTDFGRSGGAGGMPVYAAQGGTVVYAGAARGFGGPDPAGWVVIDHPTADGSGTTVYGHIIREVSVGQRVKAGQRIGRVNPNSATNGGVAPHLHFEVHPTVWRQGSQIDPIRWLAGAKNPEAAPVSKDTTPVVFGLDISEFQDGLSLVRAAQQGLKFVIIRTTDGTHKDRVYQSHYTDAVNAGMVVMAYHYLRNPSEGTTISQQVKASLEVMGRNRAPIWLDCETPRGLHVNHIREAKRLFEAAGVRVLGIYSYVPYWENRVAPAEPDTHNLGAVWVAAYGADRVGRPQDIYPGNSHRQWSYPLGNQKPMIWQFGSKGSVVNMQVDVNAYRGSLDTLRNFVKGTAAKDNKPKLPEPPTPAPENTRPSTPNSKVTEPPQPTVKRTVLDLLLDTLVSAIVGKHPK